MRRDGIAKTKAFRIRKVFVFLYAERVLAGGRLRRGKGMRRRMEGLSLCEVVQIQHHFR